MLTACKSIALDFSAMLWYVPVVPWLVQGMNSAGVGEAALSVFHQCDGVANNKNRNRTQIFSHRMKDHQNKVG